METPWLLSRYHVDVTKAAAKAGLASEAGWVRETFRARGIAGALRYYAQAVVELLRDLTPSRRKSRYGDIEFDFDHGVNTTWANVSWRTRLRELLSEGQYQPTEPTLFQEIIAALPTVAGFTFVDLGSGKGRTLLMASDYPFRDIVGVELLAELHEVALQNLARYRGEQQQCFRLESRAGDARAFVFPPEPTVLYLFNPFPEHVLREVLANLERSVLSSPREVYVIYHNLIFENVFAAERWLQPIHRTHQFVVYRASTPADLRLYGATAAGVRG